MAPVRHAEKNNPGPSRKRPSNLRPKPPMKIFGDFEFGLMPRRRDGPLPNPNGCTETDLLNSTIAMLSLQEFTKTINLIKIDNPEYLPGKVKQGKLFEHLVKSGMNVTTRSKQEGLRKMNLSTNFLRLPYKTMKRKNPDDNGAGDVEVLVDSVSAIRGYKATKDTKQKQKRAKIEETSSTDPSDKNISAANPRSNLKRSRLTRNAKFYSPQLDSEVASTSGFTQPETQINSSSVKNLQATAVGIENQAVRAKRNGPVDRNTRKRKADGNKIEKMTQTVDLSFENENLGLDDPESDIDTDVSASIKTTACIHTVPTYVAPTDMVLSKPFPSATDDGAGKEKNKPLTNIESVLPPVELIDMVNYMFSVSPLKIGASAAGNQHENCDDNEDAEDGILPQRMKLDSTEIEMPLVKRIKETIINTEEDEIIVVTEDGLNKLDISTQTVFSTHPVNTVIETPCVEEILDSTICTKNDEEITFTVEQLDKIDSSSQTGFSRHHADTQIASQCVPVTNENNIYSKEDEIINVTEELDKTDTSSQTDFSTNSTYMHIESLCEKKFKEYVVDPEENELIIVTEEELEKLDISYETDSITNIVDTQQCQKNQQDPSSNYTNAYFKNTDIPINNVVQACAIPVSDKIRKDAYTTESVNSSVKNCEEYAFIAKCNDPSSQSCKSESYVDEISYPDEQEIDITGTDELVTTKSTVITWDNKGCTSKCASSAPIGEVIDHNKPSSNIDFMINESAAAVSAGVGCASPTLFDRYLNSKKSIANKKFAAKGSVTVECPVRAVNEKSFVSSCVSDSMNDDVSTCFNDRVNASVTRNSEVAAFNPRPSASSCPSDILSDKESNPDITRADITATAHDSVTVGITANANDIFNNDSTFDHRCPSHTANNIDNCPDCTCDNGSYVSEIDMDSVDGEDRGNMNQDDPASCVIM